MRPMKTRKAQIVVNLNGFLRTFEIYEEHLDALLRFLKFAEKQIQSAERQKGKDRKPKKL